MITLDGVMQAPGEPEEDTYERYSCTNAVSMQQLIIYWVIKLM